MRRGGLPFILLPPWLCSGVPWQMRKAGTSSTGAQRSFILYVQCVLLSADQQPVVFCDVQHGQVFTGTKQSGPASRFT
ncbi:uncharacterized protein PHACADRAFT_258961 [Phanerochaete carnosa HHB-10118-sp]|uniref:Secreted protein n=1 Tax=Phanerochaete carnosa (strain HHB-10118-sp) TaxID=650164 RepID=K5W7A4_PHACS|nr:uncharacterized protein PHACADRAFT_258961 [Phanerochaete carnosa HHB-10118-sp]EKM54829.1 hypothetical protein PHACADRAFT_258961 [Phanerochaete carnosa HHB-10118-sp]